MGERAPFLLIAASDEKTAALAFAVKKK